IAAEEAGGGVGLWRRRGVVVVGAAAADGDPVVHAPGPVGRDGRAGGQCAETVGGGERHRGVGVRRGGLPQALVEDALGGNALLDLHGLGCGIGCRGGDERVLEQLLRRPPLGWVSDQTPRQEVLPFGGEPRGGLRDVDGVRDVVERGDGVGKPRPRSATGGHLDDRAPECPDVRGRPLRLAARGLRRQEHRRAPDRHAAGIAVLGRHPARAPEVGEHRAPVGADEHVPALDIAVRDPGGVDIRQPAQDIAHPRPNQGLLAPAAAPLDLIGKRSAGRILQEQIVARPAAPVHRRRHAGSNARHDERRGQSREHALLAPERAGARHVHGLDREHAARPAVRGDRHRRRRAAADDRPPPPLPDRAHSCAPRKRKNGSRG
ncbi:Os02g0322251, partial [Oryza sativa Japonica Group]